MIHRKLKDATPDDFSSLREITRMLESPEWEAILVDDDAPLMAVAHKKTFELVTYGDDRAAAKFAWAYSKMLNGDDKDCPPIFWSIRSKIFDRLAR